jgi:hypothetical protein
MKGFARASRQIGRPLWAETAPIDVTRQGPLTCQLATFAVATRNDPRTSTPAFRGAKTLLVQMGTNALSVQGVRAVMA